MSVIGTFKANGKEFTGEIATLTIRAKDVRIVPAIRTSDNGPSHRVHAGSIEIGAGCLQRSHDGKAYLSVKSDNPSLMDPIHASLLADEGSRGYSLIWSRESRQHRRATSRFSREPPCQTAPV